jgi:hypothetical protein
MSTVCVLTRIRLANFDNQNAGSGSSSVNAGSNDSWEVMNQFADTVLTWDDIRWLVSITHLPVVVKGIMRGAFYYLLLEASSALHELQLAPFHTMNKGFYYYYY